MMASLTTIRCFSPQCKLVRHSHTSAGNSNFKGNFPLSAKTSVTQITQNVKPLTSKRNLQSFAQLKNANKLRKSKIFDPIAVGAKSISTDPCLSAVTLGDLRDAKQQSQKLQERILRWIWEGESWAVFAENQVQITKVKLLPNFMALKIYWSATGVDYVDKMIQRLLNESAAIEIQERMQCHADYQGIRLPAVEFIADLSQIQACELATGEHSQHPDNQHLQYLNKQQLSPQNSEELFHMHKLTGITSLKVVEDNSAKYSVDFGREEDRFAEKSQVHGLDYQSVMAKILKDPSSLSF